MQTSAVSFRVLTYNVHRCRGRDRVWSPERIAAVIGPCKPDIVALQELDVGRARSGHIDQAELIAGKLGMDVQFFPVLRVRDELYGDAILSRWPIKRVKALTLPGLNLPGLEPRGALWSVVDVNGQRVQVINTHLSVLGRERQLQVEALMGPDWIGPRDWSDPAILMGDINATPRSRAYRRLCSQLKDAFLEAGTRAKGATFPSRYPTLRLDYVLTGPLLEVLSARTLRSPLARLASDHLPVVVDLRTKVVRARPRSCAMAQSGAK